MRVGVIRVEGMAVERMEVLHRLRKSSAENLVTDITEFVVEEEMFARTGFMTNIAVMIAELQVVFIAVPGAYASHLATESLRLGIHTFLGRSTVPSIAEYKALAALGEEAGAEVGVSRIMRFHPFLQALPDQWRPATVTIHHDSGTYDQVFFQQMIEDAVDLCCSLAGMGAVRKIEAQLVQNDQVHSGSLMVGFRFQNGTYAQVQLRQGVPISRHTVYVGGGSFELEADLKSYTLCVRNAAKADALKENSIKKKTGRERFAFESKILPKQDLIEHETIAFLKALANRRPVPMSILDGLQTLVLIESIRQNLR